jgi:hypothetical protein
MAEIHHKERSMVVLTAHLIVINVTITPVFAISEHFSAVAGMVNDLKTAPKIHLFSTFINGLCKFGTFALLEAG